MINQSTLDSLKAMRLTAMAAELERQLEDTATYRTLGFEERIGLLVDAEWNRRQANKLSRYIKNAHFAAPNATIEGIEYHRPCIAEERGTFASSPAMFADGTAAFASSAAPAATSPAPAATALCQHRTRRGIATLLASHRLRSRFPEEASGAGRIARSHLHSQPYRHDRVLGGTGTPSR